MNDAERGRGHDHDRSQDHGHDHSHDDEHDHHHHDVADVAVAVITVSTSRSLDDDPAGDAIERVLEGRDDAHVASRDLVPDDRKAIGEALAVGIETADAVVTTGGTGVSPDDVTVEVVGERFEKELPGFGELFRRRSEPDIGDRVVATRATAGVVDRTPVFCLPGSEHAARLGAELVASQAAHLAGLADR